MILTIMEWPSVLVQILFVISPGLFLSETHTSESAILKYVTPNKMTPCPNGKRPCLTLKEYASERDTYFMNNTVFYFHPGIHRLGESLRLKNVYNFSFQGLPTGNGVVNITFDSLASITWEKSRSIKISSISFFLRNNFTFIITFELSLFVQLSNISIYGNGYSGCSSIMSQESNIDIDNSMFSGIEGVLGAALKMLASDVTLRGVNIFRYNTAAFGGSIYSFDSILTLNGSNLFLNNTSSVKNYNIIKQCNYYVDIASSIGHGGAIFCKMSFLRIYGHSNFTGNVAESSGGAIKVDTGHFIIQGNASFCWNTALSHGGAMQLLASSSINGNLSLKNNEAFFGGAISVITANVIIQGDTLFDGNSAKGEGGALFISDARFIFCGSISYVNNKTNDSGGALSINGESVFFDNKCSTNSSVVYNYSIVFFNNMVTFSGGAIECKSGSNLRFIGIVLFDQTYGNTISSQDCDVTFLGTTYFNESHDSAIISLGSNITFMENTYFYNNTSTYLGGGAIRSLDSIVMFSGTVYFERNMADSGGAIFLEGISKLIFKPILNISFIQNHANDSGGAIYFKDSQCSLGSTVPTGCFITIDGPFGSIKDISLHFENNSAEFTGSILYGGRFGKCRLFFKTSTEEDGQFNCESDDCNYSDHELKTLMNISTIVQVKTSVLDISSPAKVIRPCRGDETLMSIPLQYVHPGQWFNISLIALGEIEYPVPTEAVLKAERYSDDYRLSPSTIHIKSTCTHVSFQLHSSQDTYKYSGKLYPQNYCQNKVGLTLSVDILPCPLGFDLSKQDFRCVCGKKLKRFTQNCYILDNNSTAVERITNNFWIYKESNKTLILHEFRCPLDYCNSHHLNISLTDSSLQCDINRNGIVCGQCQKNFSLALGSLHCIPCDNNHAALIVLFALAGVALIAIIFLLRLTVAVGTLNGLLFYANIVQANQQAFFPRAIIYPFTTFISWLNLDLGIETCFYNGMDIYAYSWFQFIFPFYVWFLIGCIIVACRYSQSIAKRLGQNPVAVLATLLMSYSKILQAIIVPLSRTYLTYYTASSNETRSVVWLYDASIHFFKDPKHIALGFFAISSSVIFVVPYIFLLLFNHWLQGCSNRRIFAWINKIKPFMDAYHAPYKKHARYWTGLLLLSRLGLFLTFANDSDSINVAAVSAVSIALLAINLRVYEHLYNDILESSFLLNLGTFSVATFYLKEESKDSKGQFILSSISVGIAFVTFIGILLFHVSLVLRSSSIWKLHMLSSIQKSPLLSKIFRIKPVKDDTTAGDNKNTELHVLPTSTEIDVDLREPLLEITES